MTAPEETTFLGMPKDHIPLAALILGSLAVLISLFAFLAGQISAVNDNVNALRAEMNANDIAFRAEMNANDSALRAEFREDFRALDSRVDTLAVEMAEMNARLVNVEIRVANTEMKVDSIETRVGGIETRVESIDARLANTEMKVVSIERQIPDYNDINARFSAIERDQTRLRQRLDAIETQPNPE